MDNKIRINQVKGLLPYNVGDSGSYYTDETQAEIFFRQLKKNNFVVLTGNTGAGKTSFVNCIFSQDFKEISNIDDSWNIVYIRPGLNPIKSIAFYLSNSNFSEDKLSNRFVEEITFLLKNDSNGLAELFEKYTIKQDSKLLLVIDPLDDLFLLTKVINRVDGLTAEQHVDAFINLICTFEQQGKDLPVYTVISFSNTFPEKVGQYPKFLDLMEKNKFIFNSIGIDKAEEIIDHIVPEEIANAKDYKKLKDRIKKDLEDEFSDTIEWLFFLQHALKQTIHQWHENMEEELCSCYEAIGGVKESIIRHADGIYDSEIKRLSDKDKVFEKVYELVLRALIDSKGQFVPKTYGDVVLISTRIFKEKKEYLEGALIKPFIHLLAEQDLGFLEIIRSTEETDRAITLVDNKFIANADVISIRNKCLISKWPRLETFQNAKVKLIGEYEWYSRFSYEKKVTGKDNYPTTLQANALADPNRDKNKDPEEFKIIDELLTLNEAWEMSNLDQNRKGFANISDTQEYIRKGLDYWREKAAGEDKERKKKERAKSWILYGSIVLVALLLIMFTIYKIMLDKRNDMKIEFDCLSAENQRILSYIDKIHIDKLTEHAKQDRIPFDTIEKLRLVTDTLKRILMKNDSLVNIPYYRLYDINEWTFMWEYQEWKEIRDAQLHNTSLIFDKVLNKAINDNTIATIDTVDKVPSDAAFLIKRLGSQYIVYKRVKGVKQVLYTSLDCNNTTVPDDSVYYLQCESCKKCKDCN